ncbi:MAG: TIGR02206 family membrane protein [Gammaproteobacteria bacterium]|nr:TIGR02206 family membrane protein [Gammaproteobacteria bacterium]
MNTFALFGPAHSLSLLLTLAIVVLVPVSISRVVPASRHRLLGRILAAVLLLHELGRILLRVVVLDLPLHENLPLHLCGAALILTALLLWRHSYRIYEVAYFWAMGGSIPALLTPDLPVDFPHPGFITFFTGHGLVLLGIMYATIVYQFRPQLRSVGLAIGATVGYALIMIPVNLTLDTNYLYLCRKPAQASLMDYLGPWPWYVLALFLVTVVICWLCYLPFAFGARPRARRSG